MNALETKKNILKRNRQPIGWWLLLGRNIYGKILFVGSIKTSELLFLSELATSITIIENNTDFFSTELPKNIQFQAELDRIADTFDAVIIDSANSDSNDDKIHHIYQHYTNDEGVVCLYERNPYTLKNLFRTPFKILLNLVQNLREKKFLTFDEHIQIKHFPTLSYGWHPDISFRPGNYHSNKNTFLIKEKIKSIIFNSKLYSLFTNRNIWLLAKQGNNSSLIDGLRTILVAQGCDWFNTNVEESLVFYKYGKLIFNFKDAVQASNSYYVVVTLCEESTRQRQSELNIINSLRSNSELSKYIQGAVTEYTIDHFPCFVMKNYSGITVDINNKNLDKMTYNAYKVIVEVAQATLNKAPDNDALINSVDEYVKKLVLRMPDFSENIIELGNKAMNYLKHAKLQSVCVHGDMKLENFMLNSEFEVSGIIDWELTEKAGLPLMDLYYLIVYSHQIKYDAFFVEGFIALCENNLEARQQSMIDDYRQLFEISSRTGDIIKLVFLLHHYSTRYFIDPSDKVGINNFVKCLNTAENKLAFVEG